MNVENEIKLLKGVELIVGDDVIKSSKETFSHLTSGESYDLSELENILSEAKKNSAKLDDDSCLEKRL